MYFACRRGCALLISLLSLAVFLRGQTAGHELANLREDVRLLNQRMGELQLRVEQLERENLELRSRANAQNYATVAQLNEAIADLNRAIKSSSAAVKTETLQQVSSQMERLAQQTNNAIDSLARGINSARSPVVPSFSDDFPKEGISYTVQKGDTLALIAKKTGASARDIINANKLADPSRIQVGQTLFIPGGK
jgi:LysM repeat protein